MIHVEPLKVKIGDLVPGSFIGQPDIALEDSITYYPALNWEIWEATFRYLRERPDQPSQRWPLYPIWQAMCQRRFGRLPSEDLPLDEGRLWTWSRIDRRCRQLFEKFRGGYRPEMIPEGECFAVYIERGGEVCVMQGNKRIGLMRTLNGLDFPLEVKVRGRHPHWVKLKEGIQAVAGGKQDVYQPIDHPDFAGWKITQPCTERLEMILAELATTHHALPQLPRRVIDLGCHTGWFSRELARQGCDVLGVDNQEILTRTATMLSTYRHDERAAPRYVCMDADEFLARTSFPVNVCLYLSIMMHTFARLGPEKAWRQLDRISSKCRRMFVDCAWGGYSQYLPFTADNAISEIIAHTQFTGGKLLGHTQHENRPFWVFWK